MAEGHRCTSRSPDVSLRGAKRRGNLAVHSRIVGKPSAKSQLPSRDCHVGLRPPRNDKSESFTPQNAYRKSCQSAWRSASAATDAIGACHFNDSLYGSGVRSRARLSPPYSALRKAMGKTPLSTLNSRRLAGGYPRTGISSNPGRAPIPRRGSDCSRPDCAPRPPRASARRPAAGSARPTERNTSRFP